jgi:hypothetical protein
VPAVGKGPIGAAEMELMEMSCRRPGEAWSIPALAAPAVAGERVARPVKPCNAPTTKFSVGRGHRGHTIEPGSFTAEVDGDVNIQDRRRHGARAGRS